jgi:hypothetical protein
MTFISMHSVIICVVFSGAHMRCTLLYSLKPGCYNTLPFARCLRRLVTPTKTTSTEHARASRRRRLDEDRRGPPSSSSLQDEGSVEVYESHIVTVPGGPCGIRPIVTGPVRRSVLRSAFVIAFTVMTVCNLPSWEYSGDKLGTRGHKRL